MAKFSKARVWSKVPDGSILIFYRYSNFLIIQCRIGRIEGSSHAKNQPTSFRTPTRDGDGHRQIDRQTDTGP